MNCFDGSLLGLLENVFFGLRLFQVRKVSVSRQHQCVMSAASTMPDVLKDEEQDDLPCVKLALEQLMRTHLLMAFRYTLSLPGQSYHHKAHMVKDYFCAIAFVLGSSCVCAYVCCVEHHIGRLESSLGFVTASHHNSIKH